MILSIGEVLDPINDLVERFSSVMLVAASSLGLQNILLGISRWWGLNVALAIVGIAAVVLTLPRGNSGLRLAASVASRMFVILLFLRFAVPLLVIGTNIVSEVFLDENLAESTAALEATRSQIEEINEAPVVPDSADRSVLDRLGRFIDESLDTINAAERLERLKVAASEAAENIVNLIVIFVLQTILLPLAILWVLLEIVKGWISRMTQAGRAKA